MKLSISNIGWAQEQDQEVYRRMREYGFTGLEIAPTRIFPKHPYEDLERAARWSRNLREDYGICISSMQSIWYGRQDKIFGKEEEREMLACYTKQAIDFAAVIGSRNLVFGCPRNRQIPEEWSQARAEETAIPFFKELGDYAASRGTVLALEANPPIYHTNFMNDTASTLAFIERVASAGFLLNLDVGTMIENGESPVDLSGQVKLINHVHVSEPNLKPIQERELHKELLWLLERENYQGFLSIEMGKQEDISEIEKALSYIRFLCKV